MTENTASAVKVHIQLVTGTHLWTNEFDQARADLLTEEITAAMENPDTLRTLDFPDSDGWRVVVSKYITQMWHVSRTVNSGVLDGGQP